MTGFFDGQKYGCLLRVFSDSSCARCGVTAKSIIEVYDQYDFVGIWEDIKQELGEEEVFLIINNAKTHLPFMRWLREHGITLLEIPPHSQDLNAIEKV